MRPEQRSNRLLGITRAKAKMIEYNVLEEYQSIDLTTNPNKLFTISIGMLGDLAAAINRDESEDFFSKLKSNLLFSARFFDSYLQSKLNDTLDPYLVLMGSASYYLCDLPGSSSVLAKRIDGNCPDLDGDGLENLLLWLLQTDLRTYFEGSGGIFGLFIDNISQSLSQFFKDGTGEENLFDLATKLRNAVYEFGTPRQLLLGDVIVALFKKKLENSVWKALPAYSGLSRDKWLDALKKETFIKELWPAQHLLGKAGVLKGESAVVQMPTSAGKTKATELIIRSAFLSNRILLAIIIAPFRALCHEIKDSLERAFHNEFTKVDELSDALQTDFEIVELLGHQQILVVTPEKLLYVLRHAPELAVHVGLLIFDEGHQFDSGTRGINYELLVTSLRSMVPKEAQKILISAVISNAKAIGEWLNGAPNVVEGTTLLPTFRSIGFTSWLDQLGRIEYVDSRDTEQSEFFVPRVIERINLGRKKREKNDRLFPEKSDGKAIALYLGLKLVSNGSIAVFCGTKSTAAGICERAIDIIEREVPLIPPSAFSNTKEVGRLTHLHEKNLGVDAPASRSAAHGIFSHHGNTPHGIRLAVEYAMRENLVRFVVCTSTLAQGVNLPIRYLIVSGVYQGMERIKVRDFHNLIGRAGRAGIHTEGSVLFADPMIFDKRKSRHDYWRWEQVKELLEPHNSEPCISNLLSIFDPLKSDDGSRTIPMEALDFAKAYISAPDNIAKLAAGITERYGHEGFSREGVERQFAWRVDLICAIESFLLSHWDETEDSLSEANVIRLAEDTLAFFLSDDWGKGHIRELFQLLATNISANITDSLRRKIYGKTLYGVHDAQAIEKWVQSNSVGLLSIADETEVLDLVWSLLTQHIVSGVFTKFDKPEVLKDIAHQWIDGKPYRDLLNIIHEHKVKMIWGTQRREFKIGHIVDVCEGKLAYDGGLLIGALCEFIETLDQDGINDLITLLQLFQKRLKYGLPTETAITLYELGFSDRVISQDLATALQISTRDKKKIIRRLKDNIDKVSVIIEKYPQYYQDVLSRLIQN